MEKVFATKDGKKHNVKKFYFQDMFLLRHPQLEN